MSYDINVPLGQELRFPDYCPFSNAPSPKGLLTLRRNSSSFVIPIPGIGFINTAYNRTSFRIPVRRRIVLLAFFLDLAIWAGFLGGFAAVVYLINTTENKPINPTPWLLGGCGLAVFARCMRFWVMRKVRICSAWGGFVEVRFQSEQYAKEFSELNRLPIVT